MDNWNTKRDGVRVRIIETGEEFNSIKSCADYLGVNASWLGKVTRGGEGLCTCHGYHIVPIDISNDVDLTRNEYRGRPGIKVRIVETGEIFNSITECADAIGGSVGSIHDAIYENRSRRTHMGYHFELAK